MAFVLGLLGWNGRCRKIVWSELFVGGSCGVVDGRLRAALKS
jgi:hypothetical protein